MAIRSLNRVVMFRLEPEPIKEQQHHFLFSSQTVQNMSQCCVRDFYYLDNVVAVHMKTQNFMKFNQLKLEVWISHKTA